MGKVLKVAGRKRGDKEIPIIDIVNAGLSQFLTIGTRAAVSITDTAGNELESFDVKVASNRGHIRVWIEGARLTRTGWLWHSEYTSHYFADTAELRLTNGESTITISALETD